MVEVVTLKRDPDSSVHTAAGFAEEAVKTFIMSVFGENLPVTITKCAKRRLPSKGEMHAADVEVEATFIGHGHPYVLQTTVPMIGEAVWQHADIFFPVYVNGQKYDLWCSEWTYDNFKVIAHSNERGNERWYVGDGFEDEVLFRGQAENLPWWAKSVARRHFSSLVF